MSQLIDDVLDAAREVDWHTTDAGNYTGNGSSLKRLRKALAALDDAAFAEQQEEAKEKDYEESMKGGITIC